MRKLIWLLAFVLLIAVLGVWLLAPDGREPDDSPDGGVIREESLDIRTDNPQPAGRNITY